MNGCCRREQHIPAVGNACHRSKSSNKEAFEASRGKISSYSVRAHQSTRVEPRCFPLHGWSRPAYISCAPCPAHRVSELKFVLISAASQHCIVGDSLYTQQEHQQDSSTVSAGGAAEDQSSARGLLTRASVCRKRGAREPQGKK